MNKSHGFWVSRRSPHWTSAKIANSLGLDVVRFDILFLFRMLANNMRKKIFVTEGVFLAIILSLICERVYAKGNCQFPFVFKQKFYKKFIFTIARLLNTTDRIRIFAVSQKMMFEYKNMKFKNVVVIEGFYEPLTDKHKGRHEPSAVLNVVSVGTNEYLKGHDVLISLLEDVSKITGKTVKLQIVGYEKDSYCMNSFSVDFSRAEREEIIHYLDEASIMLHLARFEPNSVAVMEALDYGIPVILSNTCGQPECINIPTIDLNDRQSCVDSISGLFKNFPEQQKIPLRNLLRKKNNFDSIIRAWQSNLNDHPDS